MDMEEEEDEGGWRRRGGKRPKKERRKSPQRINSRSSSKSYGNASGPGIQLLHLALTSLALEGLGQPLIGLGTNSQIRKLNILSNSLNHGINHYILPLLILSLSSFSNLFQSSAFFAFANLPNLFFLIE